MQPEAVAGDPVGVAPEQDADGVAGEDALRGIEATDRSAAYDRYPRHGDTVARQAPRQ